ncbi:MAG: ABC transporter substrate-binding protein [Armatimonadota bacterium]|nr:ABC transporter substrate-binding protein [Armatimonadota bacterium]MDR7519495.1 ABC transporter substrate-binding protein [Armatimonadota bacterium]MDR7549040.1 ABC transporter substrate-binding protein [Armatimonadota bacterium]
MRLFRTPTAATILLTVLLAGAGWAQPPARPAGRVALKFTNDWIFDGSYAPLVLAQDRGYYAEEGLNVTLDRGFGSADAVAKIGAGAYHLGVADLTTMIEFNAKNPGRELVAVLIMFDGTPASIVTLRREGITRPIDLYGKRLGAPAGSAPRVLWPLFARAVGMHPASVEWVTMAPPLREPMLFRGEVNAVAAFSYNAVVTLKALGADPRDIVVFPYHDYGLPLYGLAVMAPAAVLEQQPQAVRGFVRALIRAWQETVRSPAEAIRALKRFDPLINEDVERERLELALQQVILTGDVKTRGYGAAKSERLSRSVDLVADAFNLPAKPAWQRVFTDRFLPPRAERMLPAK